MDEEQEGLTLGEYFRIIFKRVWWVVGATLLGLAAAMLIIGLWYNRENRTYSLTYKLTYPNSESGYYPDGTVFIIEESVSLDALTDIKNGKYSGDASAFGDIDVEEMVSEDEISLITETDDTTGKVISYTLTVHASYFTGKTQALAFMHEVAEYPVNRINEIVAAITYDKYLTDDVYNNASTYDNRIELLETQKTYIETMYELISDEGGDDVTLNLANLQNVLTTDDVNKLNYAISNQYLRLDYETYIETAKNEVGARRIEIEELEAELEMQWEARDKAASASGSTAAILDAYDQRIKELTSLIAEDKNAISTIYKTLNKMGNSVSEDTDPDLSATELTVSSEYIKLTEAFDVDLETYRSKLKTQADTLKNTFIKVYSSNSKVTYTNNKLVVEDDVNLALAAVLGAVLGFVIVSVVICCIDGPKYRRKKYGAEEGAGENAGGTPSDGESGDTDK